MHETFPRFKGSPAPFFLPFSFLRSSPRPEPQINISKHVSCLRPPNHPHPAAASSPLSIFPCPHPSLLQQSLSLSPPPSHMHTHTHTQPIPCSPLIFPFSFIPHLPLKPNLHACLLKCLMFPPAPPYLVFFLLHYSFQSNRWCSMFYGFIRTDPGRSSLPAQSRRMEPRSGGGVPSAVQL